MHTHTISLPCLSSGEMEEKHQNTSQFSQNQVSDFREAFALFDKDGNGSIDASELGQVMASLGHNPTKEELQKMVGCVDLNGDGSIDFEEFLEMMHNKLHSDAASAEAEVMQAFMVFDKNGDGFISREELRQVMASLGENLTEDDLTAMMAEADTDGDGRIDLKEFAKMMGT